MNTKIIVGKNNPRATYNTAKFTSDDLAINAAITEASTRAEGRTVVEIKDGNYIIVNPIFAKNNVTVKASKKANFIYQNGSYYSDLTGSKLMIKDVDNFAWIGGNIDERQVPRNGGSGATLAYQQTNKMAVVVMNSSNIKIELDSGYFYNFGVGIFAETGKVTKNVKVTESRLYGAGNNDVVGVGKMLDLATFDSGTLDNIQIYNNFDIKQNGWDIAARQIVDPLYAPQYYNAFEICKAENVAFYNNTVNGNVGFSFEDFPHRNARISNNIIKRAGTQHTGEVMINVEQRTDRSVVSKESLNILIDNNTIDYGAGRIIVSGGSKLKKSENFVLDNNTCKRISLFNLANSKVINHYLSGSTIAPAIDTDGCENIEFNKNTIIGADYIARFLESNNISFTDNTGFNNNNGILGREQSKGLTIKLNRFFNTAGTSIDLIGANDGSVIDNNTCVGANNHISVDSGSRVRITNNKLENHNITAIRTRTNYQVANPVVYLATITNGGTGYSNTPSATLGNVTLNSATQPPVFEVVNGVITKIRVFGTSTGSPTITITDSTGTGATATLQLANITTKDIYIAENTVTESRPSITNNNGFMILGVADRVTVTNNSAYGQQTGLYRDLTITNYQELNNSGQLYVAPVSGGTPQDFFRSGSLATPVLPDGTNDLSENIARIGNIVIGSNDQALATSKHNVIGESRTNNTTTGGNTNVYLAEGINSNTGAGRTSIRLYRAVTTLNNNTSFVAGTTQTLNYAESFMAATPTGSGVGVDGNCSVAYLAGGPTYNASSNTGRFDYLFRTPDSVRTFNTQNYTYYVKGNGEIGASNLVTKWLKLTTGSGKTLVPTADMGQHIRVYNSTTAGDFSIVLPDASVGGIGATVIDNINSFFGYEATIYNDKLSGNVNVTCATATPANTNTSTATQIQTLNQATVTTFKIPAGEVATIKYDPQDNVYRVLSTYNSNFARVDVALDANTPTNSQVTVNEFQFRYSGTGNGGQLELRSSNSTAPVIYWTARRNTNVLPVANDFAGSGTGNLPLNNNTLAFVAATITGGLTYGHSIDYIITSGSTAFTYDVRIINVNDGRFTMTINKR